jgi:Galactosyltransferase
MPIDPSSPKLRSAKFGRDTTSTVFQEDDTMSTIWKKKKKQATRMMLRLTAGARRSSVRIAALLALLVSHYLVIHFLFFDTGSRHEGRLLRVDTEDTLQLLWENVPLKSDPYHEILNPDIIKDSAVITGHNVSYKLPGQTFYELSSSQDNGVVVGVLSAKQHRGERDSIRETWAYRRKNVFFILAGEWKDVEEEFLNHHDIIWVSTREGYYKLTWKTQVAIVAMEKHMKNFRHILKTDDDAYVHLDALEHASAFDFPDQDYIGRK